MNLQKMMSAMVLLTAASAALAAVEHLPSWHDSERKAAIVAFVESVSNPDHADFVPAGERIAVFDNDGTLWAEQPVYFQLLFAMDRIHALADQHPEWQTEEPFASVLRGDVAGALGGGHEALFALINATHGDQSATAFAASVAAWVETARHPTTERPYTSMVYQPMLELLDYLRAHEFTVFIVSGGGIDFMRVFAESVYGVPPHQVIGSQLVAEYEVRDGVPMIVKQPEVFAIDDKAGKPVMIHQHIGRRPIFAAGNSDGDFQMLEWSTAGDGPRFGLLVHHTDAEREWAYDRESHIGQLVRGLDEAEQRGWTVVDMAADWASVFPAASAE